MVKLQVTGLSLIHIFLFVGTKKQAQDAVKTEAERCGMYFVNERWLGGMPVSYTHLDVYKRQL